MRQLIVTRNQSRTEVNDCINVAFVGERKVRYNDIDIPDGGFFVLHDDATMWHAHAQQRNNATTLSYNFSE